MYFAQTNLGRVTRQQYVYKMKAYTGLMYGLLFAQAFAILMSLGGIGMMGTSDGRISLHISRYSGEMPLWATLVWTVVTAQLISQRTYQNMDFTFVTNRISSNLSNIGFLLTAAVLGAITASLNGILFRVLMYFAVDSQNLMYENFFMTPGELFIGTTAGILYIILISSIGYLTGILARLHKIMVILLPSLFIGLFITALSSRDGWLNTYQILHFFVGESSLPMFAAKVIVVSAALFAAAIGVSNRMEVRR